MSQRLDAIKEFYAWCEKERAELDKAKTFMEKPDVRFEENGVSIKERHIERLTEQVAALDELIDKIQKEHFG